MHAITKVLFVQLGLDRGIVSCHEILAASTVQKQQCQRHNEHPWVAQPPPWWGLLVGGPTDQVEGIPRSGFHNQPAWQRHWMQPSSDAVGSLPLAKKRLAAIGATPHGEASGEPSTAFRVQA